MRTDTGIALSLSVADWNLIDTTLDNITVVTIIDDPPLVGKVLTIRRLVWRQRPPVRDPEDQISSQCQRTVRLLSSQWEVVRGLLERSARTSALITGDKHLSAETRAMHDEIGADQVRLAAMVRAAMG